MNMIIQQISGPKARVRVHHEVAYDYDEKQGLWLRRVMDEDEIVENLITDAGTVQLHKQCYNSSALLTNGFNWIGLSNDAAAPAEGDTTLASEISGNGLDRVQAGTITMPTGVGNQSTIANTFTFTGASQGVQKSALFVATGAVVMAHEVQFTQRTLATNDTLTLTYTVTLG
jgi:hypothetical protein